MSMDVGKRKDDVRIGVESILNIGIVMDRREFLCHLQTLNSPEFF